MPKNVNQEEAGGARSEEDMGATIRCRTVWDFLDMTTEQDCERVRKEGG